MAKTMRERKMSGRRTVKRQGPRIASAIPPGGGDGGYRLLFENHPQPIWVHDTATLAFLAVNNAALRYYGYSRDEFLAMTIRDIRPPEDVPALVRSLRKGSAEGERRGIWRHRKKDGTVIDVDIASSPIPFEGRNARLVLARDVTEQRRLEAVILRSSEEWRDTLDAMTEAVALLDREGRVLRCNAAMARLSGMTYAEIIGLPCAEICGPFPASGPEHPFAAARCSRRRATTALARGERQFEVSADPLFDSAGAFIGAVYVLRDITDRRLYEAALRASEERYRLLFQNSPVGVFQFDRDLRITACNDRFAEIFHARAGQLVGLDMQTLRDQRVLPALRAALRGEQSAYEGEYLTTISQEMLFISLRLAPISDRDGMVMGGMGIVEDVTERIRAASLLRDQKRFTEDLIRSSAVATFVVGPDHRVMIWNRACEELTGVPAAEMVGTDGHWRPFYDQRRSSLADLVIDSAEERIEDLYQVSSRSALLPEGVRAEGWFRNLNGRDRYLVFDAAPIRDGQGRVIAAIETLQDITDRKRAEEEVFRAKQDWEYTFNSITDMVTVHDKDFNIILANRAAEKILGLPLLDLMKERKCFSYYHGTDAPPAGCPSCDCLQTGKPAEFEVFEPHLNRHIELRAVPRVDSEGKIIGLIHTVRDINDRKLAQAAAERYSSKLAGLNTASNRLIGGTRVQDIYQVICAISHNLFDVALVWLGIIEPGSFAVRPVGRAGSEDGYLGQITVTWDDGPLGQGPTGRAIRTRHPQTGRPGDPSFAPWRDEAGKRGFASSLAVPLLTMSGDCIGALNFYGREDAFDADTVRLIQVFANQAAVAIENARLVEGLERTVLERTRDLEDANTELQAVNRELEQRRGEAEQASRAKTDFLANMSHELRTPLNAIIGFSDIMLMEMAGPLADRQREFLKDISGSAGHLLTLINDILDLSKIEAGKMELDPDVVSVRELIASSLDMFKEKALRHRISTTSVVEPPDLEITADGRKLKQVLVNLLSNAYKFTPDGGSVEVAARALPDLAPPAPGSPEAAAHRPRPAVEISVQDTGIGISRENQRKLFQPFQQGDKGLTRNYSGTGLGLNLCRRIVELHGGRIWVESDEGRGSTFFFTIPVVL